MSTVLPDAHRARGHARRSTSRSCRPLSHGSWPGSTAAFTSSPGCSTSCRGSSSSSRHASVARRGADMAPATGRVARGRGRAWWWPRWRRGRRRPRRRACARAIASSRSTAQRCATSSTSTSTPATSACACAVEREGQAADRAAAPARGPTSGSSSRRPRPGEIATCANKCVFCFIHQLPRGMRKSLYVKDDDFRLSFLHGNYITLTDLDEAELARIEDAAPLAALRLGARHRSRAAPRASSGEPRVRRELLPRHGAAGQGGHPRCTRRSCCARAGTTARTSSARCASWRALHPAVADHRGGAGGPHAPSRAAARAPRALTADEARALVRDDRGLAARVPRHARHAASSGPPTSCISRRASRCPRRARTRASRWPRTASGSCAASRTPSPARCAARPARAGRARGT